MGLIDHLAPRRRPAPGPSDTHGHDAGDPGDPGDPGEARDRGAPADPGAAAFFATVDGTWFRPGELCRGPWDPDACHGGPPAGLLARAAEAAVPHQRLVRLTVDLVRPVPLAGFSVTAEVTRAGRTVSTSRAVITGDDGRERAVAHALHLTPGATPNVPTTDYRLPHPAEAEVGPFPIGRRPHGLAGFRDAVAFAYPPGETPGPGPTTAFMRSIPLVVGEEPSPFQRICPLADCGNALGRNADPGSVSFVNPDLTVTLHRPPEGEWLGSRAVSHWQPDGIGLADALLFDHRGVVGRAVQTVVLRPAD